jgi:hypothetical protein
MRVWTRVAALAAFAGAAIVGARAGADNLGLVNVALVAQDPAQTWIRIDAGPDLEGQPLMVRFGPDFKTGPVIGGTALHGGVNYVAVPNFQEPGWYTTELMDGRSRGVQDTDPGEN